MDGVEVARQDWSFLTGGFAGGCGLRATVSLRKGRHRLAFIPLQQTHREIEYLAGGTIQAANHTTGERLGTQFEASRKTLRVGQQLGFAFEL